MQFQPRFGLEGLESRQFFSDTLAMFTWGGDANLDGKITIDDYGTIDANVPNGGTIFGWHTGDFNYDGVININDYGVIDFNVNSGGGNPFATTLPFNVGGTAGDDDIVLRFADQKLILDVNGKLAAYDLNSRFRIDGRRGNDAITIAPEVPNNIPITIYGGGGNDTITCGAGEERVYAGEGDDVVTGNAGRDHIYGEGGNDGIRGGGSSDLIDGGDGADTLRGDSGNDNISGGANSDRLRGSAGNDRLDGGGGRDHLAGEDGDDLVLGGAGPDVCDGGSGADDLQGGRDHDVVLVHEDDAFDFAEASAGECWNAGAADSITVGSGGLTKSGGGTLTLTGSNSYTGDATITAGTLLLTASGTLHSTSDVYVGVAATFAFARADVDYSVGGLDVAAGATFAFKIDGATHNTITVLRAGGLNARGGVIDVAATGVIVPGAYTLIDYEGTPVQTDFTLGATPPGHTFRLARNEQKTSIDLVVS